MSFHGATGCPFSNLPARKAKAAAKKAFRNLAELAGQEGEEDDT